MTYLTLRDQIIRGLERLGYERDLSARPSSRYTIFKDHLNPGLRIYVGKIEAVRRGRSSAVSEQALGLKRAALTAGLPAKWSPISSEAPAMKDVS
jgi:hypothetical protein